MMIDHREFCISRILPRGGIFPLDIQIYLYQNISAHSVTEIKIHHLAIIYTTKIDASVCLCAKFNQFLPVRSHFDTKRPVNSVRTATFHCANFGPLLFAFYCPLLFYENKIKNEKISPHFAMF